MGPDHVLVSVLDLVLARNLNHAIVVTAPKIEQKTKTSQRINLVTRIREGTRTRTRKTATKTGRRKKGKKRKRKGRSVLKALTKTPPTKRYNQLMNKSVT